MIEKITDVSFRYYANLRTLQGTTIINKHYKVQPSTYTVPENQLKEHNWSVRGDIKNTTYL